MSLVNLVSEAAAILIKDKRIDGELVSRIISRCLGYGIIAGACFVKVPQLLNVHRSGSAEGLSHASIETELFGYMVHSAYSRSLGLPFSAYGESFFVVIQNFVLLLLVYKYGQTPVVRRMLAVAVLAAVAVGLFGGFVPKPIFTRLFEVNSFVFMGARIPQIYQNFKSKSTGQLSSITCIMNLGGALARIFTSFKEGATIQMVRAYILSAGMHLTMLLQILAYSGKAAGGKKVPGAAKKATSSARRAKKVE